MSRSDAVSLAYLVTIVTFVLALRFLSSPKTARLGNWLGAAGMALAIAATFAREGMENLLSIVVVMAAPAPVGAYAARAVKMTAMPQMVALFNGVGGGAAALIALAEFNEQAPDPGRLPFDASHGDDPLRADREHLVRGQHGRVREAARARHRPPDRLSGAEGRERAARRRARSGGDHRGRGCRADLAPRGADRRCVDLRSPVRPADRRGGHAGRDRAPERIHGARRIRDRVRAARERPHRQRHARRRVGNAADAVDGQGDGAVGHERALRRVRPAAGHGRGPGGRRGRPGPVRWRRGRRGHARLRPARRDRARLRHGRGPGAARRPQARRRAHSATGSTSATRSIPSPAACPAT